MTVRAKKLVCSPRATLPSSNANNAIDVNALWESRRVGEGEGKGKGKSAFLGYMYLDLFPRENKYGHAAVWGLIPGWTAVNGEREYPVVCMVANLAKSTGGKDRRTGDALHGPDDDKEGCLLEGGNWGASGEGRRGECEVGSRGNAVDAMVG
ncbi:hypothetical protein JCM6882_007598 [Rhodosporidiobolus microsporus]